MLARRLIWTLLLAGFFVSTLTLSLPFSDRVFVSPDENAAFVFAQTLAGQGSLAISEPLNDDLQGLLHPRSAIGYDQSVLPGSFLGFIMLLAGVGKLLGVTAIYLVTPTLAVMTVLLWRDSVRRIFQDGFLADVAALCLMIHPAFWYYSGRVMMHNVAFLAFIILAVWVCLAAPVSARVRRQSRVVWRHAEFVLAGLAVGVAINIRTSELPWLVLAAVVIFGLYRAQLGWRVMVAFGCGVVVMLGVLGLTNQLTYGSPFVNGYTAQFEYIDSTISAPVTSEVAEATVGASRNLLLPFGFHERVIVNNVLNYGYKLYPWMSTLALVGLVLVFTEKDKRARIWKILATLSFILAVWLTLVYGSWKIIDNPDPKVISLGNSHVRYWLPLFTLASLFAARTFRFLIGAKPFQIKRGDYESVLRHVLVAGIAGLCILLSFQVVFFGEDGFVPTRRALASFVDKRTAILANTEVDAILVVDRADKYLFPARRVVVPLRSEATYSALPAMLELAPVYYFGITLPPSDVEYLNTLKLPPLGVRIEYVSTLQEESLYRFVIDPS